MGRNCTYGKLNSLVAALKFINKLSFSVHKGITYGTILNAFAKLFSPE